MKKKLLWLPVVVLVLGAAIYSPAKEALKEEAPVSKNISFAVFKKGNYASAAYNNTFAQIHIIVEKVNGKKRSLVWDTTLDAKRLNEYPSVENALSQNITVPNVFDKKEHLEVTYTLTFDSKGSKLQMQGDVVVSHDIKTNKVDISI
ncbi:MAG TPA: hypothetical protein PLA68_04020 [Panacibacter sp.]|nr:hypothetical protein [Panacibacter sp.]